MIRILASIDWTALWLGFLTLLSGGFIATIGKVVIDWWKTAGEEDRAADDHVFKHTDSIIVTLQERLTIVEKERASYVDAYAEAMRQIGVLTGVVNEQRVEINYMRKRLDRDSASVVRSAETIADAISNAAHASPGEGSGLLIVRKDNEKKDDKA